MGKIKSYRLKPGTRIDGYFVKECLGRGWESEAYLVVEKASGEEYALKLMRDFSEKQTLQYVRKLENVSDVVGVVKLHDRGYWKDYYLVVDYVQGTALRTWSQANPMGIRRALQVVGRLLQTIAGCHARKTYVGDLDDMSNVILTSRDEPTIIDLDWKTKLTKDARAKDVSCVLKMLHKLTGGKLPAEIHNLFPYRHDHLKRRYKDAPSAIAALRSVAGQPE